MWPIPISTLFFELGSHIEPVAYLLVRVAGSELQVFFFSCPVLGFQMLLTALPAFYLGFGDLNSSLLACTAGVILT